MADARVERRWLLFGAILLALGAALYLWLGNYREQQELSRLWSRLHACVLGEEPLGSEPVAARLLALRRGASALADKDKAWPRRCQPYAKELAEAKLAQQRAPALASAASRTADALDKNELTPELWASIASAADKSGLSQIAAGDDVPRAPAALRPLLELVPFADLPKGTRIELDQQSIDAPEVFVHSKPAESCRLNAAAREVICSAPAAEPRPQLDGSVVARGPELGDGSTLALVELPLPNLEDPPGAKLVRLGSSGAVSELPAPELAGRWPWRMGIAGSWAIWIDQDRIRGRRFEPASGKLSEPVTIAASEPELMLIDGCRRRAGQVLVLGRKGEPAYSAHDSAVVLFESEQGWKSTRIADVHLFHDPGPAFERARVRCDDGGVWLTWSTSKRPFEVVRCTPSGCKRANWGAVHAPVQNARVVELGGKVFLLLSRHEPSAILLRSGAFERMPELAESCLVEGAYVVDVLAAGDSALLLARTDHTESRAGAFRLDASGKVEPLKPAER